MTRALVDAQGGAEALTLLDTLARAPAAAVLVVAALKRAEDRKALRLAHMQLRDAVGEAATKLTVFARDSAAAARPPTPRRWPRLEELTLRRPDSAALEALSTEPWGRLRTLRIGDHHADAALSDLDEPAAHALAAALRRMPALRLLELWRLELPDAAAEVLFGAEGAAPGLRTLAIATPKLSPAAARALAAAGWPLEELHMFCNRGLGAAGVAALLAAPTFAICRLSLGGCGLDAATLLALANAPWPLDGINLSGNDFSAAATAPALAALSRHAGLRKLNVSSCRLSTAVFKALVEATWPALTYLGASRAAVEFDGPHALGAAAFAGFPALEELHLSPVELGEAGARLLASRRWARLRVLFLEGAQLGDAGLAALARGAWPAMTCLSLRNNGLSARLTLEAARRWAPALVHLYS